jgi:hypothetical protein
MDEEELREWIRTYLHGRCRDAEEKLRFYDRLLADPAFRRLLAEEKAFLDLLQSERIVLKPQVRDRWFRQIQEKAGRVASAEEPTPLQWIFRVIDLAMPSQSFSDYRRALRRFML